MAEEVWRDHVVQPSVEEGIEGGGRKSKLSSDPVNLPSSSFLAFVWKLDIFIVEERPLKDPISMLSQMFYRHGHMCATHPWEVILAFLTVTICLLSVGMTAPMCGLGGECKGSEILPEDPALKVRKPLEDIEITRVFVAPTTQANGYSLAVLIVAEYGRSSPMGLATPALDRSPKLTQWLVNIGYSVGQLQCHRVDSALSQDSTKGIEAVVLTTARCMAVLYVYHQFRRLYRLGSKYLVGIAGLLTVFSSFVFSSTFVNLLDKKLSELNVALPFFLLLMDFSKAGLLAQFALSASSKEEVRLNIAEGMAILGPAITLDTLVETLVIGVGTLSVLIPTVVADVRRLEHMCCYACMSAVVNYIVFMTFFPACLSLIIELSRERKAAGDVWRLARVLQQPKEEEQMPNPVLQRVKVIMSAGLVLVHARSRWSPSPQALTLVPGTEPPSTPSLDSWLLPFSAEQMVILVLASALAIKYIWFETREDVPTAAVCRTSLADPHRPVPIRK
ncbi:HMGCR, partial [Cordylochernes scorpioides]